jgi:hypothetical protein
MTYTIQLLVKNMKNINYVKDILYDLAAHHNCIFQYFQHEMEGIGCKIKKNTYIQSINFENIYTLEDYIKMLRGMLSSVSELKIVRIDTIYNEDESYIVYDAGGAGVSLNDLEKKILRLLGS